MGINEQYFSAAMERLEERRRANRLESDKRRSEVESKIPEYRELSLKLGSCAPNWKPCSRTSPLRSEERRVGKECRSRW